MNSQIFTKDGKYLMLALDHRSSFRKLVSSDQEAIELKRQIIEATIDQFSGVLIDQDYGFPAYVKLNPKNPKPFLLPMEESGYTDEAGERLTKLKYFAKDLKEMGAAGAKLLVYFNPGSPSASKQLETSKIAMEDAHSQGLPFFLEIVTYNNKDLNRVVESVKMFLDAGIVPDIFKLEYPESAEYAAEITKILKDTPWILLTRGASFDDFVEQLKICNQNGCKGFLAGRGLWQELPEIRSEAEKTIFLTKTLPERFRKIATL